MKEERGQYGQIQMSSLNERTRKQVQNLFSEASKSDKVDEHGNWEFGAEFDKKGRGYAINWDLYAVGKDFFSKKTMCIIQIRKWEKRRKNGFANVQKSYFLLGRNEDKTAFAHPVESRVIHHAIKSNKDVIRAVQDWMFGCDYTKVLRQGDVCLYPCKKPSAPTMDKTEVSVDGEGSHFLTAKEIRLNGSLYALDPSISHIPGTHPNFIGLNGWWKVVVSKRGRYHDFATPTID